MIRPGEGNVNAFMSTPLRPWTNPTGEVKSVNAMLRKVLRFSEVHTAHTGHRFVHTSIERRFWSRGTPEEFSVANFVSGLAL